MSKKPTPAKSSRPRPGLGRGLGALIEAPASDPAAAPVSASTTPPTDAPAPVAGSGQVSRLPVERIARCPWQPRQVFNPDALRELADSIRAHGLIQPLICRRDARGGYQLIAGERRLRAAVEAGLAEVPAIVMEAVDRDAAEMAIIENIQREDLNVIEEAEGYRTLGETFGLTQQDVADRVGKARASVANALRLLELPDEVKQLLSSGRLSTGHAKVLLALTEEQERVLLARRSVTDGLTVRALEKVIQRRLADKTSRREAQPDMPTSHVRALLDRLHARFGTQVRLSPSLTHANGKRAKGVIEIDFYDNDDLDRLLGLLGIAME